MSYYATLKLGRAGGRAPPRAGAGQGAAGPVDALRRPAVHPAARRHRRHRRIHRQPLLQAADGDGDDLRRHAAPARRGVARACRRPPACSPERARRLPGSRARATAGLDRPSTRRPRGRPLHRPAPADRLHGRDRRATAPSPASTCAARRPARARPSCSHPVNAIDKVHAILLAGGSAFGLDAAGGVMRWLDERGIGATIGAPAPASPRRSSCRSCRRRSCSISGSAIARIRPDAAAGHAACEAASRDSLAEGNVGAGAGASVGKLFGIGRAMKGGIGTASIEVGGITVAALVAVNAIGDVVDPRTGRVVAGARTADGRKLVGTMRALQARRAAGAARAEQRGRRGDDDRRRRHRRRADQGRSEQGRADGARRPRAQHQPGPHDGRRRRRLRPRHRRERPERDDDADRRARRRRPRRRRAARRPRGHRESAAAGLPDLPCAADLGAATKKEEDRRPRMNPLCSPAAVSSSPPRPPAPPPLAACATRPGPTDMPPIVFVHGNGDTAGTLDRDDLALRVERLAARSAARDRHALPARARRRRQGAARPQLDRRVHEPISPPR